MDAVIFDFDGTLVDTEPLHEAALRTALAPEGVPVEEGMSIGLADEDAIRIAFERVGRVCPPAEVDRLTAAKVRAYTSAIDVDAVVRFDGAIGLLRSLAGVVPVGICTAAMRAEVEPVVEHLGLTDLLACLSTADDVTRKKPHPEAYLHACAQIGVEPTRALALEDSPRGVRSAVDAGLVVLALGQTTPRERLSHAHAFRLDSDGLTEDDLRMVFAQHRRV